MFQSLIGRLQTVVSNLCFTTASEFQSLIGRLQTPTSKVANGWVSPFQSLIGRLQTEQASEVAEGNFGFNPS